MATIYALDNEFAASTGNNVGVTSNISIFDNPPNSFNDLVIESNPGDTDPYLFEVGETYSLSYGGHGGGGCIENATIIRSDFINETHLGSGYDFNPSPGVIVFEGYDPDHGLVQIVYSPGFDLESWFWDNTNDGITASFWTSDRQPENYGSVCFAAGTRLLTPTGMRPVDSLRPGDLLITRDNGAQPVRWLGQWRYLAVGDAAPVVFEPGAFGNEAPLLVSQQHRMLISGAAAELHFGEPEILAPAKALINGHSIRLVPQRQVTYLHVLMECHEILEAEGAAAESLLLGDMARQALDKKPGSRLPVEIDAMALMPAARPVLRLGEAQVLAPSAPNACVPALGLQRSA